MRKDVADMLRASRVVLSAFAVLVCALVLGCNSSSNSAPQETTIIGAGSTFVNPIMTRWIADFHSSHAGIQINYQSIGSGGGIQQLKQGLVDFGASDAALDDQKLQEMPALVQIPESAGPVCITYNLPGLIKPLRLSAGSLAGIYLGKIKTWRDPSILKDNPLENLPGTAIGVAHRSDGSGTTNIFTTYLAAVSAEWDKSVGKGLSVKWPVGVGGKGSEGVTGAVKQTPGAIGYVELSYATENKLPVAWIQNQAGQFVEPTAAAATSAIDAFKDGLARDVRTPVVNPPATASQAYPISGLTFLLVPKQGKSAAREEAVKQFVQFIITDGQGAAETLQYSRLPQSLVEQDNKLVAELPGGGGQQTSKSQAPQ
jgi:phosphate transport system substrate-binding protein